MENNIFEIRFFANISGFEEIRYISNQLFSADVFRKEDLDIHRGNFRKGSYILFFGKACYAIVYKTENPGVGFRDGGGTYIAIAIKREYVLTKPTEVFTQLDDFFFRLASAAKDRVAIELRNNMQKLLDIVSSHVVIEQNQPIYQFLQGQLGLIGYENPDDLDKLLCHPMRKELDGYHAVYIVDKSEASRIWESLSDSFTAITNIDFDYNRTYKLRYPDGHQEEISGIDYEVNRDCEKAYCEPIKLHGNLKDHMREWQVALSEDKITYQIGLQFKPLRETYEIVSKEKDKVLNGVQYSASVGTVEGNMLTLVGEETVQTPVLALSSGQHFKIEKQEFIPLSKQIFVKLSPLYRYDVSALWNEVKQANGEDGGIVIALIDQEIKRPIHEFSKRDLSSYFDLSYSKAAYVVRETKKYKECTIFINPDGTIQPGSYRPERKERLKVTFDFQNAKELQDLFERESVTLSYASESGSSDYKVGKSSYTIEGLPFERCTFTIRAKGYRPFKVTKNYAGVDRSKSDVDFTDVIPVSLLTFLSLKGLNVKRLAIWLLSVAVAFLIGGAVGLFTRPLISDSKHGEQTEVADSCLLETIKGLKEDTLKLNEEIDRLKDLNEKLTKQIQGTVVEAKGPGKETTAKRTLLVKKLRGTAFTMNDIKELREMSPTNEEKKLIASCEACLLMINWYKRYERETKSDVVHLIRDNKDINTDNKKLILETYGKIIGEHKKVIDKIIKEYGNVYMTKVGGEFESIQAALDACSEEIQ